MVIQNSRRILSILKKVPESSTLSEVASTLSKQGVLAPYYKVGQEVYLTATIALIDAEWLVVKGVVQKIVWDGKYFQYYIKYDHPKYGEIPDQAYDDSHRGVLIFNTERTAQSAADKLNAMKKFPT